MQKYDYYKEKAFLLIYFLSVYAIMLLSLLIDRISKGNVNIFISYAVPQIIYISVTIIYSIIAKVDILKALPIKAKIKPTKYIWTLLATVGIFCFSLLPNFLIMYVFNKIGLQPSVSVPNFTNSGNIILGILIICIMPAIGEEMVFRGVCNSSFREYGGVAVILLSGLMFSLSHFNIAQTIYQFFIGATLSYLYLKTNNLLIPILIHFLNNLLALFLPTIIPFFTAISMSGITFAVLVPMFIVGLFVAVMAVRKLVDDTIISQTITVYEYQPGVDDFVAIATEKKNEEGKKSVVKKVCYEIEQNFKAIFVVFNKHKLKEKTNRFQELYPKRKKINSVIKLLIAVIIGLWLISVFL